MTLIQKLEEIKRQHEGAYRGNTMPGFGRDVIDANADKTEVLLRALTEAVEGLNSIAAIHITDEMLSTLSETTQEDTAIARRTLTEIEKVLKGEKGEG